MTGDRPLSVILVDDHRMVRQGVRAFLGTQDDLDVVGEASSGSEGVVLAARLRPDVALVDLVMEGLSGVDATREILQASPGTRVLVLTSFDNESMVIPALRAGASSYLLKDVGADALADAVRRTARGEAVLHPKAGRWVVDQLTGDGVRRPDLDRLTSREAEILHLIAQGHTNAAIAGELTLSEKTVKGHVSSILAKLNLGDRTQAAVFAWRHGIAQD